MVQLYDGGAYVLNGTEIIRIQQMRQKSWQGRWELFLLEKKQKNRPSHMGF